jgi:hypothetical protein
MSLRRFYHRHFGYHGRFHVAVVLTIIVIAYVVVPRVARLFESVARYSPAHYEPKDLDRERWLREAASPPLLGGWLDWDTAVGIALVVLVAVVWLTFVPARTPRRRTPPQ